MWGNCKSCILVRWFYFWGWSKGAYGLPESESLTAPSPYFTGGLYILSNKSQKSELEEIKILYYFLTALSNKLNKPQILEITLRTTQSLIDIDNPILT